MKGCILIGRRKWLFDCPLDVKQEFWELWEEYEYSCNLKITFGKIAIRDRVYPWIEEWMEKMRYCTWEKKRKRVRAKRKQDAEMKASFVAQPILEDVQGSPPSRDVVSIDSPSVQKDVDDNPPPPLFLCLRLRP
ncbi:hypothetical protein NPIL_57781 [Nephila pilipes]|uniref:Uncharacterized protein n=1 Tax=Nephila pilipes TaxID=299642 RepID=A0A8X6R7H1_NEPPI|nr:hypothetical protein NPIL_57781 [Nephila pilipes]